MAANTRAWKIIKTGSNAPEISSYEATAGTYGSGVRNLKNATILVVHDADTGVTPYIIAPAVNNAERLAGSAATALGGRAEPVADIPDLDTSTICRLIAVPNDYASRTAQAGADPTPVAEYIARNLPQGSWCAVTLRAPSKAELNGVRRWNSFRETPPNHHTSAPEVLVASIIAGGEEASDINAMLEGLAAVLPGFDIDTHAQVVPGPALNVAASIVAAIATYIIGTNIHSWIPQVPAIPSNIVMIAALLPALVALGYITGIIPTARKKYTKMLDLRTFPTPAKRSTPPRKPKREYTDKQGKHHKEFKGDYPLANTSFLVGPKVILGVASPHGGANTGASATNMRSVSPALRKIVGLYIGDSGDTQVHISQADRYGGFATAGTPGSGKSVVIHNIFAYDSILRTRAHKMGNRWTPLVPGDVGANNTLIAIENKGQDGVDKYKKWLKATGDSALIVEVADPLTPAIDLFDIPGSVEDKAAFFVAAMRYSFGDTSIGAQSANTLTVLMRAALLITPEDLAAVGFQPMSPLEICYILLAGYGDVKGVELVTAFTNRFKEMDPALPVWNDTKTAIEMLGFMYGPKVTEPQRRKLTEAPISKVGALLTSKTWWDPDRPKTTWDEIIKNHWVVIINTGQSTKGHTVTDELTDKLTPILMYTLQKAITRHCAGWDTQGRAVSIYSDELFLLIGDGNGSVFGWLRDAGRSFGVRAALATQRPGQLKPAIKDVILSFSTFLWYAQQDPTALNDATRDIGTDGSEWSQSDIATLEPHHGILRATVNKRREPSAPIKVKFWGGKENEFAADQNITY